MNQCFEMNQICSYKFPFCAASIAPPTMKMFFHFGIRDYLLFESWVPSSMTTYLLALLFCLSFGVFYEYLVHLSSKFEVYANTVVESSNEANRNDSEHPLLDEMESTNVSQDQSMKLTKLRIRIGRSVFRFVILFSGYICMLLAMTFNVGYFVFIVLGVSIGTFLFNDSPIVMEHCR